jgi:predicted dehydrogenase
MGTGFGVVHVAAFRRHPCEVVALCGTRAARTQEVATQLGIPCVDTDWRRVIAREDVQLIALAVPAPAQLEIGLAALEAGKHVFLEKPLAPTLDGARRLAAAALRNRRVLAVNFEFPELPAWREAKRVLDAGRLGSLRHAAVTWRVETYAGRVRLDGWKARGEQGGGALNMFTSHSLHYLDLLFGPIRTLSAQLGRGASDPRPGDTLNTMLLTTQGGVPVVLTVATDCFLGTGHRVEIFGDSGTLVLDNPSSDYAAFQLYVGDREQRTLRELPTGDLRASPDEDGRIGATAAIIGRMLNAIANGDKAMSPGIYEGVRVQACIDAALRSSTQGGTTLDVAPPPIENEV